MKQRNEELLKKSFASAFQDLIVNLELGRVQNVSYCKCFK